MKTYRCWAPEHETEGEARKYNAENWRDAAERYAFWSYGEEEFDELTVNVRCENGELYTVDVESEMELHLYLGLGEKLEDKPAPVEEEA